ncbi:hypothetical protein C0995_008547 [Termitomyces sp. Mi166|nr:hypothetical protein C0995_008547 [Termitomyces sp. Mi166\
MSTQLTARLLMASRHSALPFLYPCCNAFAAVPTRRAMMSAFRSQPGLPTSLATPPNAPSASTSNTPISSTPGATLNADAGAPQVAARPPPPPKVEKARPKIRASKAALTITPRAVARLQGLLAGPTPQLIRIGVRNKGCAGLSYHLEYVDEGGKFDEVVEQDGVRVLIDSKALFSIIGSEMDWTEDALRETIRPESAMDFFPARPAHHDVRPFAPAHDVRPFAPSPSPSPAPAHPYPFAAVLPADLPAILDDPRTLLVDIRPHAAHADARLPRALSLSVPSTLLKRPLFSLQRLAEMIPSSAARHRFSAFNDSARILVYDADSNAIPESSNIYGLLRKFRSAHFAGELAWLRGGFQAVWREQRQLIDTGPQPDEHDDDDTDDPGPAPSATGTSILCTRRLPMSAFGPMSTTLPNASSSHATNPFFDAVRQNVELSHGITERIPLRLPNRVRRRIDDLPFPWLREIAKSAVRLPRSRAAHPPTRPNVQMQTSLGALRHRISSRTPPHDHIRYSISSSESLSDSSDSDPPSGVADVEGGTETLAMQFHSIELAEQRRLMGVMEHHSKESRHPPITEFLPRRNFPFSITAGVEKGSKNRYQHIWPFEHARVKLYQTGGEGKDDEMDDYVNASFVQPLGTTKKYIATQGPLEATFEDFWRLTWQQNVHVIVMLTQEVENSMVKCGTYWSTPATCERTFGMLHVTLVAKVGLPGDFDLMHGERPQSAAAEFGFDVGATNQSENGRMKRVTMIKRTFRLEHRGYPNAGPREVVQLQYLKWPDMNVPEDAKGVLGLVREVERAVRETGEKCESPPTEGRERGREGGGDVDPLSGVAWHVRGGRRPILLHCSAGVGRTGCFIALDAVLDAVRREVREKMQREKGEGVVGVGEGKEGMDVDDDGAGGGKMAKHALTVAALPLSGQLSPGESGSASAGLVVHVPAVVSPQSNDIKMDDIPMTVDGERQEACQWATNLEKPSDLASNSASPLSPSLLSPPSHTTFHGGTTQLQKHVLTALTMNSPPSSASTSAPGSLFPLFSDSEKGVTTSISSGSAGNECDGKDFKGKVGDGHLPFRTASEPQSQAFSGRSKFHLSLAGSSPPARSTTTLSDPRPHPLSRSYPPRGTPSALPKPSHQLTTVDYKEPRALHALPKTPLALSTFDDPIWEVVQDMREQRMSLCQSLRQYVFVHQVVIEGALRIVDEEREREGMVRGAGGEGEKEAVSGKAMDDVKFTASPLSLPFSFGTGRAAMNRSSTFPPPGAQVRSFSMARQPFPPPLSFNLSDTQQKSNSTSSGSGFSSDSGSAASSTMKRGASPTELLKEGKKGELLLSKRPSIKRKILATKEDTQGGVAAVLEPVPSSPRTLQ